MNRCQGRKYFSTGVLIAYVMQLLSPVAIASPPVLNSPTPGVTIQGAGTTNVTINSTAHRSLVFAPLGFDTVRGESVNINQANTASMLVRIGGPATSYDGLLNATGTLFLLNPNGIFFGPNAQINVGALIASSLHLTDANFLAGQYLFQGAGVEGAVKNMGSIHGAGGVYLLAPNVENHGVITSPGGHIVLAAGTTAYLSSRPDGNGLLAELRAPAGQALNVGQLIADGGQIGMAGLVVNQSGLVQANSVRERNGKIELYAGESLMLKAGSQTLAQGGKGGVSDGGTVLAVADKLTGTATFEKGATLDVSGGANGGHAGFAELSGSRVGLGGRFVGSAKAGYRAGRLLIDPTMDLDLTGFAATDFADISFSTPRDASGNLLAGYDLRVTGVFDLNSVQPPSIGGTIRFDAGQDLIFNDLTLFNNPSGVVAKWDIVGIAERSILFTGFTGTTLHTAHRGSINLQARTGNVNLIDSQTGALATVRTEGGGGISIKSGQDLIASTSVWKDSDSPRSPLAELFPVQGLHIEGSGRLNLEVGRDFVGGPTKGVPTGPGFVLSNSDLANRPQHTVTVGGKIGQTNLTLGSNGLPLTAGEQRASNPNAPLEVESSARYADFALSGGELLVSAGGNVYLGRVRDAGLVGGGFAEDGSPRSPQFAPGLENNKVTIISRDGHVLINTDLNDAGRQASPQEVLSALLPASFEARAEKGSIQIRSNLKFLPSPTGSVKFFAKNDIQGVPKTIRQDDSNFAWLWVGRQGVAGGHWEAVDARTIPQRPDLWPYWNQKEPPEATLAAHPSNFPEYGRIDVDTNPPTVKLLEVNPGDLIGKTELGQVQELVNNNRITLPDNTGSLAQVSFKAELGNISKLVLDLVSRPFRKEVTIEAGNRIEQFNAQIYLPELGTQAQTVIEHLPLFLDPATNQLRAVTAQDVVLIRAVDPATNQVVVRPWNGTEAVNASDIVNVVFRDVSVAVTAPNVAATIRAKDIVLSKSDSGDGGIQFYGSGTAKIIATHDLDLADGRGILADARPDSPSERGGLIDIAVGHNLDMVTSAVVSRNGAGISIHGYDQSKPYIIGYDNSALYPLWIPDSARAGINVPAAGGKINVGENSARSQGRQGVPTGLQVVNGGSVGQMAREAVVNPDGTVTVNLVRDPAAILIRAKGDIDVNKSRIATFGGGDIRLTSTQGNINAGSGSKDERVLFAVETGAFDSQGNRIKKVYEVPGSGIFTFHPDDPQPLVFPKFSDPEINALLAEAARQRVLGRDVTQLEAKANRLREEREPIFNQTVLGPFIDRLKLGDITLTAEKGNIIIPPAGIRGRNVELIAPHGVVDFRGGEVVGRVRKIPIVVGTPSIPVLAPPGVAPPPPPLSGGGAAAAASATAAASSTTVKNADQVQESASESSSQQAAGQAVASKEKGEGKDTKSQLARAVRIKRGVVIQVDVKPQAQPQPASGS